MIDGLWTVEFISTTERHGHGVIVLNNNRLLGGDEGYFYFGSYNISNNKLHAEVTVVKYNPNIIGVFGSIDHFQLILDGEINDQQFKTIGTITNNPQAGINVIGTKRKDL